MRVAVLTSSRADFGIYLPLLKALQSDPFFDLEIIAFGTHLSFFHGYTINQIEEHGFIAHYSIESMLASDSKESVATAMSLTMMKFSAFWQAHQSDFDLVFCLGDRYEMFSAVMAGVPFQIKFAHLHGGETTLGAIDNVFRHAISHASSIHFTSTQSYKERIEQMVDAPAHVYYTGALGLDNLQNIPFLSLQEFKSKWGIDLSFPTILVAFHPETVNPDLNAFFSEELVKSVKSFHNFQFLITMPNSDTSGNVIRGIFEKELTGMNNVFLFENLGTQSYFSAMKYCSFLLGNTSSGIIEAASFGKYVINIGNRQDGRLSGNNVVNTRIKSNSINSAITEVSKHGTYQGQNIYFQQGATEKIIRILKSYNNV